MSTCRKLLWLAKVIRSNHHVNTVETGRVLGQYSGSYPRQATCLCLWAGRNNKIRRWQNLRGKTSSAPLWFATYCEPPALCPAPRGPIQSYAQGVQKFWGSFTTLRRAAGSLLLSVRLSEWNNSDTAGRAVDCNLPGSSSDEVGHNQEALYGKTCRDLPLADFAQKMRTHISCKLHCFPPKSYRLLDIWRTNIWVQWSIKWATDE